MSKASKALMIILAILISGLALQAKESKLHVQHIDRALKNNTRASDGSTSRADLKGERIKFTW